jgi:hypothetical protein
VTLIGPTRGRLDGLEPGERPTFTLAEMEAVLAAEAALERGDLGDDERAAHEATLAAYRVKAEAEWAAMSPAERRLAAEIAKMDAREQAEARA